MSPAVWVALALAVLFGALAASVALGGGLTAIDHPLFDRAVESRTDALVSTAKALSDLGGTLAMTGLAALTCLILLLARRWRELVLVAVATAGAGALVVVVKQVVGRDRPPVGYHLVEETNQSFPSGHSLGSAAVVGIVVAVALMHLRAPAARATLLVVAPIFVAAVGLSRLCLGVHWPTDILAGWTLGSLWVTICLLAYHRRVHRITPETNEMTFPTARTVVTET
ncbi:phosphatase PAP2 family protein [Nocardia panacis]|uniref:Phosphatase PAP2 family protein n=1 Tax=Nocardia panacis TaxID=2340916 RepID=A0A3A4KBC7_9NOCA|nr:phosphatase PAP2 family protein [Nocardia panacis]RJO69481.1 phosphatase PAP2 family protein [Nocardia panacis]